MSHSQLPELALLHLLELAFMHPAGAGLHAPGWRCWSLVSLAPSFIHVPERLRAAAARRKRMGGHRFLRLRGLRRCVPSNEAFGLPWYAMRVAVCSDEPYPVHEVVCQLLEERGHEVQRFGAVLTGEEQSWAEVAEQAALAVARGDVDEGIFFCWSGTGISMAANKVHGVRAALCSDPGQVRAARIWNHANVLCLSNRTLSNDMAKEMLAAWLETEAGSEGAAGVDILRAVDARQRGRAERAGR